MTDVRPLNEKHIVELLHDRMQLHTQVSDGSRGQHGRMTRIDLLLCSPRATVIITVC
jgi:hypothetical protein